MSINEIKNFTMPLIFLSVVLFAIVFGNCVTGALKSILYSISLCIKNCLIFLLPLIIFSLVFNSISKLGAKAIKFVVIIIPLICFSNFTNTMISYIASMSFLGIDAIGKILTVKPCVSALLPVFELELPKIISNDTALISGVLCGLAAGFLKNGRCGKSILRLTIAFDNMQQYFFRMLIPIMPIFILGTTLKLQNDGMLSVICSSYLPVLLIFAISAYGFVFLQYLILASFDANKLVRYIKNILPAIITGFGSMSSAAALPLSIKGTEANSSTKENAAIIVPATVNIHLVGDCFFIPMVATAIMISFGMETHIFPQYVVFALHFMLAKFAVAAVPGGGILVMLPILQSYLGFTTDMLGLITAIYVLFDPIITACNIAGNGAMGIAFDKIVTR